jgi:hypothetical protein
MASGGGCIVAVCEQWRCACDGRNEVAAHRHGGTAARRHGGAFPALRWLPFHVGGPSTLRSSLESEHLRMNIRGANSLNPRYDFPARRLANILQAD